MTKPGPNDPCLCGSGKKFKKCCREVREVFVSALAHHERGELESAVGLYERVLHVNPGHAEALHGLGVIACKSQQYGQALDFLSLAAERKPDSAIIHQSLGVALQAEQRWEESANAFARAIALQPDSAVSVLHLGATLHALGRTEDAASCFSRAAELAPGNADAYNNLGVVRHGMGQLEEAVASFRRALELNPDHAAAHNNLGGVLRLLGRIDESVASLLRALELDPQNADAHYNLGMAYKGGNRVEEAIGSFAETLRLQPGNTKAEYFLHALKGDSTPAATPPELVANLFDSYAERFDEHLQGVLGYQTPTLLRQAFEETGSAGPLDILDLGCGTGLAGVAFQDLSKRLCGVDISSRMAAKAQQRGIYTEVHTSELLPALRKESGGYDLVMAADVFVYLGDLEAIFAACRTALRPNGCFLFSAETAEGESYQLSPAGRYQHSPGYIRGLAARHGFTGVWLRHVPLRRERGADVEGDIYSLRVAATR